MLISKKVKFLDLKIICRVYCWKIILFKQFNIFLGCNYGFQIRYFYVRIIYTYLIIIYFVVLLIQSIGKKLDYTTSFQLIEQTTSIYNNKL